MFIVVLTLFDFTLPVYAQVTSMFIVVLTLFDFTLPVYAQVTSCCHSLLNASVFL